MKWNKDKDLLALNVGHGTQLNGVWDSGCVYKSYDEASLMLPIVEAAVKLLRKSGVRVISDADKKNNKNMTATVTRANKEKATLYMSVHCDYKDATAGVMPLYKTSADKKFADAVGKAVAKKMKMKYKGACKRTDLYELNAPNTTKANCIFETGSIKNDLDKLKDSKTYGRALAKAICKYIGVPVYVSNRTKLAKKANELAYAGAPKIARYPTGKPTAAYKSALNRVYPNRKKWGVAPRAGASCDVFQGTVARDSGVDKKMPRGLHDQMKYLEKSDKWKRISKKKIKSGDLILYKNKSKDTGHICMYHTGRIKHAAYQKWYGRTTNNAERMLSTKGREYVHIYRAVG